VPDAWIIRQIEDHGVDSFISRSDVTALRRARVRPAVIDALIKASDRAAAYLEATRLAGFSASEARRFFGAPPKFSAATERDYLVPWPAEVAERRYLERFAKVVGG